MEQRIVCIECGTKNRYEFRDSIRVYEGEGYQFDLLAKVPFCIECGAPIYIEEVEDRIAREANKRIREQREIISREEISGILERYHVSQKFLSKLLGWGEITLTRYMNKNYTPSSSNSNRLKELKNPYVFQRLLQNYHAGNLEKEEEKAFRKAESSVSQELLAMGSSQGKIFHAINWFLSQSSEEVPVTHLALQKLLYFTQSWSRALSGEELFGDDCQAWAHGAVYPKIYHVFRGFQYMPLPKVEETPQWKEEELKILNAVKMFYFDVYCAKALEEICHREEPYKKARNGLKEGESGQRVIDKKDVSLYYSGIVEKYHINLDHLWNIREYLNEILR